MRPFALALALLADPQDGRGPVPPEQALQTFRVPDGYVIELVAAEPDVVDPVALAFDEAARLYVAEMRDYPLGPPSGTIRRLEDADGDGRMDRATLFAEGIPFPTSVLPWRGGLLVTCAYEVLYLKDTDGDGKADERRTLLSGFGRQNSQHLLNGLLYGLDNWVYASNGLSGFSAGGAAPRKSDFRFRPDTGEIEPVSGSSQFGNTFDEWGRRFIVRHDNHSIFPVVPQEYLKRAPHVALPAIEDPISDHGRIPRLFPRSPRDSAFTTDTDSSCSITIWRGRAYVCEPVLNLVHEDELVPKGASFTARRTRPDSEFLTSTDPWCRPVHLCPGPDGGLYVADMYRAVIEHPDYIPKDIQKKLNLDGGKGCGRIYRVRPRGPREIRRLHGLSVEALAAALEDENPWVRTTAQRLLVERRDPRAAAAVRTLAAGAGRPVARLHALRTLEGIGALAAADVATALRDDDARVREHAVRLAEPHLETLSKEILRRAEDPDARVRFQTALTLGGVPGQEALAAVAKVAARDGADPWVRAAAALSASSAPAEFLEAMDLGGPGAAELVETLAIAVGTRGDLGEAARWLRTVASKAFSAELRRAGLSAVVPLRRAGKDVGAILDESGVSAWAGPARQAALDASRPVAERAQSVELLALLAPAGAAAEVERLLSAREPAEIQRAAVRALASWPGDPAGPRLLDGWASRTGAVRREILAAVLPRPERVRVLLDRLDRGEMRALDLEPHQRGELLRHPDREIRERARRLLQAAASTDRQEVVREVTAKLAGLAGDAVRGEKVFKTSCATCHRLGGEGTRVGPDLEPAIGRDRATLLVDLLDPNRAMDPAYQVYVIRTASGETVSGIVAADTPAAITLRRAAGEETTVPRPDIAELKAWPASLMPDGLESSLTGQDFADLLAFLKSR